MPQLGESIAEATIIRLDIVQGGDVVADQEVIEVETQKATMGVTTLCAGKVREITAKEGETYPVGTTLGLLDVTDDEVAKTGVETLESAAEKRLAAASTQETEEKNLHFAVLQTVLRFLFVVTGCLHLCGGHFGVLQVMAFDHRVVDGGGAGMLLGRINELLQQPADL